MKTALLATRTATGDEIYDKLRAALQELNTAELHHGAEGAGKEHAKRWAKETGKPEISHVPNWTQYGRAAGPIRGKELISACENVVAIWDGKSPGTKNELKEAKRQGKKVKLILI